MKSGNTQTNRKNNFIIKSKAKYNYKKKYYSSRSNTQEVPHNNLNIKNISKNKAIKTKNSINNNKDDLQKNYNTNITNLTSSLNSEITNKSNKSSNYKNKIMQYNEISYSSK